MNSLGPIIGLLSFIILGACLTLLGFGYLKMPPTKPGDDYPSNQSRLRVLKTSGPGLLIVGVILLILEIT